MDASPLPSRRHKEEVLTFGVEFEMAIATRSPGHPDQHPDDPRSIDLFPPGDNNPLRMEEHIIKSFEKAGLVAELVPSRRTSDGQPEDQAAWIIKRDASIYAAPFEGVCAYQWEAIEISSPVFLFSPLALDAVTAAVSVLTTTYRIQVNTSTGLHVHVGDGVSGLDFETVKYLLATIWCFEPHIESVHAPSRLSGRYCSSLRRDSCLAADVTRSQGKQAMVDVKEGLERLLKAHDMSVLRDMVKPAQNLYSAYCLGDVLAKNDIRTHKRTIEFRQHKGTLHASVIHNWIKFTVGLVWFADTVAESNVSAWLRDCVGKDTVEYPLELMLRRMGMPDLVISLLPQVEQEKKRRELEAALPIYHGMADQRRGNSRPVAESRVHDQSEDIMAWIQQCGR